MVANFGKYKRHHTLFKALREMPRSLKAATPAMAWNTSRFHSKPVLAWPVRCVTSRRVQHVLAELPQRPRRRQLRRKSVRPSMASGKPSSKTTMCFCVLSAQAIRHLH